MNNDVSCQTGLTTKYTKHTERGAAELGPSAKGEFWGLVKESGRLSTGEH